MRLTKPVTVEQIDYIVHEKHVSDSFMGLILVPVVEKFAEHLTAIDEAYDNQVYFIIMNYPFGITADMYQMNFALAHVLGATIQTALLNSSLVVIVGWGLNKAMVRAYPRQLQVYPTTHTFPNDRTSISKSSCSSA